jgi:hypothetical protein
MSGVFPRWDNLPNGGRRYYRLIPGQVKGYARYVKEVDADENTVRIVQEIYDNDGKLIGLHQKYPDDTGHVDLEESEG